MLTFSRKDPDKGYLSSNLFLPRRYVTEHAIKNALTFTLDQEEEEVDEETGERVGSKKRVLELWDETANHLIVPREFIAHSDLHKFRFEIVDQRPTKFPEVDIQHHIEFRDGQEPAFQALLSNHSGTLNLACGKGKTVISLRLAAEFRVPTLVVVNTTALMEQWKEDIVEHLVVPSIGTIQGKVRDWRGHPITLATIHTLADGIEFHAPEFRNYFGLVFYDEGHHMSAPVFVQGADVCAGRRYSLTATPDRTDGMENIYQYHLGRVLYRDLEQALIPNTSFHVMTWSIPSSDARQVHDRNGDANIGKLRAYLGQLRWRNERILDFVRRDVANGRRILILTHSVPHVEMLYEMASDMPNRGLIAGATPQEDRMSELRNCNPIFATFQLAREGLDKPELDTLYILTPFSNKNDLQQSWGRIQRAYEGKQPPLVRVFEDEHLSAVYHSCCTMRKILRAMGYPNTRERLEVT
jgi:superfamily II DNA or RNA helicase